MFFTSTKLGQNSGRFSGFEYSNTFSTGALIVIDDFMLVILFTPFVVFLIQRLRTWEIHLTKKATGKFLGGLRARIDVNPPCVI
jgi:hypothetical protein